MEKEKIIEVKDLKLYFDGDYGTTQILNGITFDIHAGETLGIVGESGCGKSQTAMSIMRLNKARLEGSIEFKGQNMLTL
ncbi:MAG: ATP-binding cassette domain-containing protein, partial [Clostridia bacterium]|nr:ATP-binding cassette domain-containing protein [Clostridia bacterium]